MVAGSVPARSLPSLVVGVVGILVVGALATGSLAAALTGAGGAPALAADPSVARFIVVTFAAATLVCALALAFAGRGVQRAGLAAVVALAAAGAPWVAVSLVSAPTLTDADAGGISSWAAGAAGVPLRGAHAAALLLTALAFGFALLAFAAARPRDPVTQAVPLAARRTAALVAAVAATPPLLLGVLAGLGGGLAVAPAAFFAVATAFLAAEACFARAPGARAVGLLAMACVALVAGGAASAAALDLRAVVEERPGPGLGFLLLVVGASLPCAAILLVAVRARRARMRQLAANAPAPPLRNRSGIWEVSFGPVVADASPVAVLLALAVAVAGPAAHARWLWSARGTLAATLSPWTAVSGFEALTTTATPWPADALIDVDGVLRGVDGEPLAVSVEVRGVAVDRRAPLAALAPLAPAPGQRVDLDLVGAAPLDARVAADGTLLLRGVTALGRGAVSIEVAAPTGGMGPARGDRLWTRDAGSHPVVGGVDDHHGRTWVYADDTTTFDDLVALAVDGRAPVLVWPPGTRLPVSAPRHASSPSSSAQQRPPPPKPPPASLDGVGKTLRAAHPAIAACMRSAAGPRGKHKLVVAIERDGRVSRARWSTAVAAESPAGRCIADLARRWRFAPPDDGEPLDLEVPLVFGG